jgi:hypothetical protein
LRGLTAVQAVSRRVELSVRSVGTAGEREERRSAASRETARILKKVEALKW